MGTKKHGSKKEVLSENSKKEPQKLTWKSKYEQICATHVTNGTDENDAKEEDETKSNALDGLSGYLSSDSSSGESELNEEVGNFLKEVDVLFEQAKKQQLANEASRAALAHAQALSKVPTADPTMQQYDQSGAPTVAWQECYDSSTGFTYYWNMETNEVTWDMPPEYQTYMEALKQWQQYQAQGVAALLQARVQQQIQQQHQLLLQQAHEHQQNVAKQKTAEAQHVGRKNKKKLGKKSDSEDEKIELITSYGPFSEEESSDTEKKALKAAKAKKRKNEEKELNAKPMGPMLPKNKIRRINRPLKLLKSSLVPYHPEIDSDVEEPSQSSLPSSALDTEAGPTTEKKLSENHSPVSSPVEIRKDEAESILSKEDDIDEHALLDRLKSQTQVLKELGGEIPDEVKNIIVDDFDKDEVISEEAKACSNMLSEERKNLKLKLSARVKKLINNSITVKVRTTDFIQSDGLKPAQHKIDEDELDVLNESNDLLSKKKFTRLGIPTSFLSIDSGKSSEVRPREEGSRGGFGFVASKEEKKRNKAERIAFVKADVLHLSEEDKGTDVPEDVEDSGMNVKDVSAVLQDKMRFLSDSKEPVPPVQIWIIQLETLLSAWESKNLKKTYLEDWLNKTRKELETLEGTVAPDGWICEWQREEKRYRYVKTSSGEISWEFPMVTSGGAVGGEEEMDLSMTPPHLPVTPPPPQISVPSPPSPPNIRSLTPVTQPMDEVPPPPPVEVPPLPPLPPLEPPSPPPPPPKSPPPHLSLSQPLPPGVDPAELPPLPPVVPAEFPKPLPPPTVYPQYYPAYPQLQPSPQVPLLPPPLPVVDSAPPPPKGTHDLSSELDSFYSDLATLEPEQTPLPVVEPPPPQPSIPVVIPPSETPDKEKGKKKKKTKLAPGLSLKKKGVSSLVAKWQQVQEDVRRDMKHD